MIEEGQKAPDFKGKSHLGDELGLDDFKGHKLALFFYPKDNTPGCTAQACHLRDNYQELLDKGVKVVGVSSDGEQSHIKFAEKHRLPFPLLMDENLDIHNAFGVWGEKKMYGRTYMGTLRTTFIIDEQGLVSKVIKKVKTKTHAEQVFESI